MQLWNVHDVNGFFRFSISATSAEDALKQAKQLGVFAPMVESHKDIEERERRAADLHWRVRYDHE